MCKLHSCGVLPLRFFALTVTTVKFANDDKSRVACASVDSTLSICQVIPPPATVICMLRGHTAAVCGECCVLSVRSFLLLPQSFVCCVVTQQLFVVSVVYYLPGHCPSCHSHLYAAWAHSSCLWWALCIICQDIPPPCCMVTHSGCMWWILCVVWLSQSATDIHGKTMVVGHTWVVSLPNDQQMMNRGTDRDSRKKKRQTVRWWCIQYSLI